MNELDEYEEYEEMRKLKQAVYEGAVDYTCPNCGSIIRGEPDAKRLWCPVCEGVVEVTPVI